MSKTGYDFYLDKCLLPVAPQKLNIKVNNANKTLTLINDGEINILKTAKLTDVDFEVMIPQVKHPFATYSDGFKGASYFLNYFEQLKTQKRPFQFIVSRTLPNGKVLFSTNIKVSLEDYKITEQVKQGFDLMVKIKLKQYREFSTKTVDIKIQRAKPKAKVRPQRPPSTVKPPANKPIGIGSDVIVNGRLHRDSYGGGPGQTRSNYRGKVNFINMRGSHPYHVTTPSGGWLGWVTASSVRGV